MFYITNSIQKINSSIFQNKKIKKFIRVYRWNPYLNQKPWFNIYPIIIANKRNRVLDLLIQIKDNQDSTLTFRRSCREGICGSCSMNIDGTNTLACLQKVSTQLYTTIYPLPHMYIIKDLIPDLTNFYNQYKLIKPWLISETATTYEHIQSKKDRSELNNLYECILCACCTTSCPSYWWNQDKYLGPAILLQAYRWIIDSRDSNTKQRLAFLNDKSKLFKCHSIMNCSKTCPKSLNPGSTINIIKYLISTT